MNFYTSVNRYQNNILFRGIEDGKRVQKKIRFQPTLFLPANKDTGWKNIHGSNVIPKQFPSMSEARQFIQAYQENDNFTVYGTTNYITQFINDRFPGHIKFDQSLINISTIDIEVASDDGFPFVDDAAHPVISITQKSNQSDVYRVWGLYDYDPDKCSIDGINAIEYIKCKDEVDLLLSWLSYWYDPRTAVDVITGWYTRLFDIPYLVNRIINVIGGDVYKKMSPWGDVQAREIRIMNANHTVYDLAGIEQLDYLDLFRKFAYSYGEMSSYKLDHVANVVLGERKLSYEEHNNLYSLYKKDFQKFIDYNIRDVQLVERLDEKLDLIALAMTMAYRGGVNYSDTFGTTAIWDSIIYRHLYSKNVAIPPKTHQVKRPYPGAYVKEPKPGMYNWVMSFDLKSLYPNIIIQYNMSPETVVVGLVPNVDVDSILNKKVASAELGYTLAPTGQRFRKDKEGFIPNIIKEYYNDRRIIKDKMLEVESAYEKNKTGALEQERVQLHNQQMAIKILMNSLYGALGNAYFRYFDQRIATAITTSGKLSILWAERTINDLINKLLKTNGKDFVIAIDTDSLYVNMDPLLKANNMYGKSKVETVKLLDKIAKQVLLPSLEKSYNDLAVVTSAYENRMDMGREVIADKGLWCAKKKYLLNVHNSEGVQYAKPKLKVMGIEAVKSSTPQVCRDKFMELYNIILNENESITQRFISDFKNEFRNLDVEDIAFPRGCKGLDKWYDRHSLYKSGTPIHVRGALVYNKRIKELGLENKYPLIQNGEKLKFVYLKMPNVLKENVISFPTELPKELGLQNFIDYDIMYEKSFVHPIRYVLSAINWTDKPVANLEGFFA